MMLYDAKNIKKSDTNGEAMNTSVITNRNRDCLACRITSGCGLIGAGLYITYHARKNNKSTVGKYTMFSIASGSVLLGVARLLNLPPFRDAFHQKSASM